MKRPRSGGLLRGMWLALATVWLVRQWIFMPVLIVGHSMEPALREGELAGVNMLAFQWRAPQRGEIVAVWTGEELVIKRIIGLPGERVGMSHGALFINGSRRFEPYVHIHGLPEIASGELGHDCYAIAGDNRSETFIGTVRRERIVGRLCAWRVRPGAEVLPGLSYSPMRCSISSRETVKTSMALVTAPRLTKHSVNSWRVRCSEVPGLKIGHDFDDPATLADMGALINVGFGWFTTSPCHAGRTAGSMRRWRDRNEGQRSDIL